MPIMQSDLVPAVSKKPVPRLSYFKPGIALTFYYYLVLTTCVHTCTYTLTCMQAQIHSLQSKMHFHLPGDPKGSHNSKDSVSHEERDRDRMRSHFHQALYSIIMDMQLSGGDAPETTLAVSVQLQASRSRQGPQ